MKARADRLIEVFDAAKARPAGAEREGFLAEACADDPQLKEQVLSLLQAHDEAGDFLKRTTVMVEIATNAEKPGDRIGHYKLLQQLGEGGCGVVYMAEQQEPVRRRVALKIIKLGMDTKQVVARFEAERQALAVMDHPNIAKVLDAGATVTGRPYFVMELVRGIKITDYCDQHNLSTLERLKLFAQVCQAIQHAHQKGIIHRDIKPSNVLVTLHDGVPVPKVIDFGIAKATEGRLTDLTIYTELHQFIGTPAYMCPEQAEMSGLDIDTRSDIYSLGVLLYELLTGQTPFDPKELLKAGLEEMRRVIREKEPARPSTRLSTMLAADLTAVARHRQAEPPKLIHLVRGDLDWIVMKALEKDRTRRYETANGLAMDIQRHLQNETVVARPPSNLYRFQKLVRRNKLAFTAATILVISIISGLGVSTWLFFKEKLARQRAVAAEQTQAGLRHEAEIARDHEAQQRDRANQYLAQTYTVNGNQFVDERDMLGALPWFAKALELEQDVPARAELQRLRLTSTLQQCPKLVQIWFGTKRINEASFSPDGKRVLIIQLFGGARIYDIETGRLVSPEFGPAVGLCSGAFDPDGHWVVTASEDGRAGVWDASNGKQITLLSHPDKVLSARFSSDGQHIVTASKDKIARIFSVQGKLEFILRGHTKTVRFATFSHNGRMIATASEDGTARIWDAANGSLIGQPLQHSSWVKSVAFSPDDRKLVTANFDHRVRVWDVATTRHILPDLYHREGVQNAEFSPDGLLVVSSSLDGTVRLWNATTPQLATSTVFRQSSRVMQASFSPDGRRVVTACEDGVTCVWDLAGAAALPVAVAGCVSQDGKRLLLNGTNNFHVKDTSSDVIVCSLTFTDGPIREAILNRNGQFVLLCRLLGDDRNSPVLEVWNTTTQARVSQPIPFTNSLTQVTLSDDGLLLVVLNGKIAELRDVISGKLKATIAADGKTVTKALFSPDARWVAILSGNSAFIWDVPAGRQALRPLSHDTSVSFAVFSPDSGRLATCGSDDSFKECYVRIWDVLTGLPIGRPLDHRDGVLSAAFSPDGKRIVTASEDFTAVIWDAYSGEALVSALRHEGQVLRAAFSADGRRLVTASLDRTARVWDAETGEPLTPPLKHPNLLSFACFDSDSRHVITGDREGNFWFWRWDSDPDQRPISDLLSLSQLLNAFQDSRGGALLRGDAYQTAWQSLRSKYPNDFTVSREEILAWHYRLAEYSQKQGFWQAATFHYSRLLELKPNDAAYLTLLQQARKRMADAKE